MRSLPLTQLLQRRKRRPLARRRRVDQRLAGLAWIFGSVAALSLAVGVLGLAWFYSNLTVNLPPVSALPGLLNPDDGLLLQPTRLYDRTGQNLLRTLSDPGIERKYLVFDPQKPDHLSPFLVQTTITADEPGFWQSSGIAWQHLTENEPFTIAEQVVERLLLPDETPGLSHALRMRLLAGQVIQRYGRAQVLEWQLNSAYYGRLAYGVESAAQLYLGKSAADLNLGEAALLAAVRQAPALNPLDAPAAALESQRALLNRLQTQGLIDAELYEAAAGTPLALRPAAVEPAPGASRPEEGSAPAFTNLVLEQLARRFGRSRVEQGGLLVITSLDLELQLQTTCTLQAQLQRAAGRAPAAADCPFASLLPALPVNFRPAAAQLPGSASHPVEGSASHPVEGSAVMLDLTNGQVLALAGDSPTSVSVGHDPGTLLTPILAVSAFARGFGPASLVWDIPGQLSPAQDQAAHPNGRYAGPLRLRQALAGDSLAPLQQLLGQIGAANAWQIAEPLGLSGLSQSSEPDQLLFSGGAVRLLDVARAYETFATLGFQLGQRAAPGDRLEAVTLLAVTDQQGRQLFSSTAPERQPVLTPPLAYLVHQVLSDEAARWPSLGYPNLLEIGRPSGAKMGRTADGRQTWTAGYTPQRLVVTWLGVPEEVNIDVPLDPRLAAGLWNALIQNAVRDQPSTGRDTPSVRRSGEALPVANWSMPAGVTKMEVCSPSGLLPTQACPTVVSEYFLNGNEPTGPDSLYRTFQINRETGLLATVFTPPEQVEEHTYLVLPPEAQSWGKLANLPVPPQSYDRIQPPALLANAQILAPAPFAVVRGQVAIRGSAAGSDFGYYQLQAGEGLNPPSWLPVGGQGTLAVQNGLLGTWDTSGQNGLFALRLQVVRQNQRLDTAILQVTVDNTPPRVRILNLIPDQHRTFEARPLTFQVEASDTVGLERIEFYVDDLLEGSRPAPPYNQTWMPLRGSHTLKVLAYDLAGNRAETSVSFWID